MTYYRVSFIVVYSYDFYVSTITCLNRSIQTSHITLVIPVICSIYLGQINVYYEFCKSKVKKALVYFEIKWSVNLFFFLVVHVYATCCGCGDKHDVCICFRDPKYAKRNTTNSVLANKVCQNIACDCRLRWA